VSAVPGDVLERVRAWRTRDRHRVLGLMTGTSADAVDAALVRFDGGIAAAESGQPRPTLVAYRETPLDPALRREVLAVAAAEQLAPERLMRLDLALGELYAACVLELLAHEGVPPATVDAIGLHGQTIRHVPRDAAGGQAMTWQSGSAAVLAERTGILVVSDFRTGDTAAGGEGAPLVPLVDAWLFRDAREGRVLLNLGGMANLTWLPAGARPLDVLAFDTGPGNAILDALAATLSDGAHTRDEDGAIAARGRPDDALLADLLADPWFARVPPRSTGRERFGEAYAARLLERARAAGARDEDVLATATELTAASVADAVRRFVAPRGTVDAVYVSGGGARNPTLMKALARRVAPASVRPLDDLGVAGSAKEAMAFACLAHRTLCGLPGNVPAATGASRGVVLGRITPGRVA
jgi:anhydro-N-acetylmuramic acid kinase